MTFLVCQSVQVKSNLILIYLQIHMTTEMERRVGNLLDDSQGQGRKPSVSSTASAEGGKQFPTSVNNSKPANKLETNSGKEKLSAELEQKQEKMKVICYSFVITLSLFLSLYLSL